ncbi:adhesion G protein-coupled receptor E3-like [Mustelus asterias]
MKAGCKDFNLYFPALYCETDAENFNICIAKSSYDPSNNTESIRPLDFGVVNLSTSNNSLEIDWKEMKAAYSGGDIFALITYTGVSAIKNIYFSMDNVQSRLPLVSNIATVISNRSQCLLSSNLSMRFRRNESSKVEDVFCAHLSNDNYPVVWTRDGCQLLHKNNTHVICNCNQMSTFAVLEVLKSTENVLETMKTVSSNLQTHENGNTSKAQLKAITNLLENMESVSHLMAADAIRLGEMKIKSEILGNLKKM